MKVTKSEVEAAKAKIRKQATIRIEEVNFTYKDELLRITETLYTNKTPCLLIVDSRGSPYTKLTVALENHKPEEGCYFIKTWAENKDISDVLRTSGLFEDTGKRVFSGYVQVEVWKRIKK